MQKIYFKEEQRFTQPWLWIILVVAFSGGLIPFIVALYAELIQGEPYGTNPTTEKTLIIMFFVFSAFTVAFMVLFWKIKLITEVRHDGLYVRFPPFINKAKRFAPDTLTTYYIRKYRAILEYGGWGIHYSIGRYGKAYNVRGNKGMQLTFKNGKKLLIGTQRGDAFMRAMKKMMKEEEEHG